MYSYFIAIVLKNSCIRSMVCFPPYKATVDYRVIIHRQKHGNAIFELFDRLLVPLSATETGIITFL